MPQATQRQRDKWCSLLLDCFLMTVLILTSVRIFHFYVRVIIICTHCQVGSGRMCHMIVFQSRVTSSAGSSVTWCITRCQAAGTCSLHGSVVSRGVLLHILCGRVVYCSVYVCMCVCVRAHVLWSTVAHIIWHYLVIWCTATCSLHGSIMCTVHSLCGSILSHGLQLHTVYMAVSYVCVICAIVYCAHIMWQYPVTWFTATYSLHGCCHRCVCESVSV